MCQPFKLLSHYRPAARQRSDIALRLVFWTRLCSARTESCCRSLAPLWCCQATQRVFSGFSCFVEQRSGQNFGVRGRAKFTSVGTFPLVAHVLKLEWDKAASYPACQV